MTEARGDAGNVLPVETEGERRAAEKEAEAARDELTQKQQKNGDANDVDKSGGKVADAKPKPAGIRKLFRYSSIRDKLLLLLGVICAILSGTAFPIVMLIFGQLTDAFIDQAVSMLTADSDSLDTTAACINAIYPNLTLDLIKSALPVNISTGSVSCDAHLIIGDVSTTFGDIIETCYGEGRECLDNNAFIRIIESQCYIYSAIAVGVLFLAYFQVQTFQLTAARQTHQIRLHYYRAILRQDIGWFDANPSGSLSSRLSDDVQKIEAGIGDKLSLVIQSITQFFAGFIVAFTQDWKLSLALLAFTPFLAISMAVVGKVVSYFTGQEQKQYASAGAVAEEVLSSIRTVLAFGGENKEVERYSKSLKKARRLGMKKGLALGTSLGILFFLLFSTYTIAFWFGAYLISEDQLTGGRLLTVFFAILIGAFALGQASPNLELYQTASGAAGEIFDTIDRTPPIDVYSDEGEIPEEFTGDIKFQNVSFSYPTRPDVPVLNNFSLNVDEGQTVALVGPSGCGKSTVVSLIERFYNIASGTITLDGRDICSLNLKWLRFNIGVVSQEPVLFDTTIAENISYGKEGATVEEIQKAARNANAHDFISQLPDGYNTLTGERGVQLSGGQKQRIAIARALVRNPKVLLLDEATSALDTESEKIVQEALDKAREGRTTIVIAHRLSTIQTADVIASIDGGQVSEMGTHSELMDREGIYYELVTAQSYGADELFSTTGAGRLVGARQRHISELSVTSGGLQSQASFQKQTSIIQRQTSQAMVEFKRQASSKKQEEWDKEIPPVSLGRLIKVNAPEWWLIVIGVVAAAVNGSVFPVYSILFGEVLRVFQMPKDDVLDEINVWAILFLALAFGSGVAIFFKTVCFSISGDNLTTRLRSISFKAMLRQEIGWFDEERNSSGALTTRLASDAGHVQGATGSRLSTVIETMTSLLLALVIAFIYSWVMTLFMIGIIPVLIVGGVIQSRVLTKNAAKSKKSGEHSGTIAVDSIENIRTVAALGAEESFYCQYSERCYNMYHTAAWNSLVYGLAHAFSQSMIFFMYAAVFRFGALLVTLPTDNVAYVDFYDVFRVFIAIVFGGAAVAQAGTFAPNYAQARLSANRIFFLLDRKPKIDNYSIEGGTPDDVVGEINTCDVIFEYPSRPGVKVLQGLDINVKSGQTLALVGPSGCGKSTVVSLIERFYNPLSGSLTLDGNDVRDLNIRWLRSQIGIVSQEPVLFDSSIADNIRYGANFRDVSDEEVIEAAKAANIHSFIESLPQGYNTNVGSKGTQLSGGQKQRIAIARALVRNPKVLLLDEATSALDTESEKIVQEALDKAREGRTSIVIAHRLSTIYNANCIVVLKGGKVAEMGTHSELLQKRGIYYALNRHQMIEKETF